MKVMDDNAGNGHAHAHAAACATMPASMRCDCLSLWATGGVQAFLHVPRTLSPATQCHQYE